MSPNFDVVDTLHHDVYPAIDPDGALKDSCKGSSAIITGAGRGIGQAIAIAFAKAGATNIILTARSDSELQTTKSKIESLSLPTPPAIITQTCDVTSVPSVSALFALLSSKNITPTILVNNAGYLEGVAMMHESDPETWKKTWDVNVYGTFLPCHYLLKEYMAGEKKGLTIINTSSIGAVASWPGFSAYQPSKTAVNRVSEVMHVEYAEHGVRVFTYHPGGVPTALALNMPQHTHAYLVETPELAAGFCVYLASSATDEKAKESMEKWRGNYISCLWDVDELAKWDDKSSSVVERWGEAGWGTAKPAW